MTESEKVRALVAYRMEQADEALRSAEVNLSGSMVRSAVNRAYYAMFYAVLALLATRRAETSRHSGAISLFDREFVKPGTLPKDFSRWLHDAFSEREARRPANPARVRRPGPRSSTPRTGSGPSAPEPVVTRTRTRIWKSAWSCRREIGFARERVLATVILPEEEFEDGPISASTLVRNIHAEGVAA